MELIDKVMVLTWFQIDQSHWPVDLGAGAAGLIKAAVFKRRLAGINNSLQPVCVCAGASVY